jgi:Uma2 family endonuclease
MPVKIAIAQIQVAPGQRLILDNISWQEFEEILDDLGEHRHSHIAYYRGVLEFRMPLPGHERAKVLISHLLAVLLEELNLEWESLGSTTFKSQVMQAGIEPDDCFYIQNYQAMIGKQRLDLTVDPVPDLAIEVDFTSVTQVSAYEALRVPEIWCYNIWALLSITDPIPPTTCFAPTRQHRMDTKSFSFIGELDRSCCPIDSDIEGRVNLRG